MLTGQEAAAAVLQLIKLPKTLDDLDEAGKEAWFRDLIVAIDRETGLRQAVDDSIKLQPGLEELSDMAIGLVMDKALPMGLAKAVSALDKD